MELIITTESRPIKLWLDNIEDGALAQARNLANLPFVFRHIAVMPDAHQGYGMPIGGVMATRDVIVPNAVGVDIGCGMCAMKTSLTEIETPALKTIMDRIRKSVPVGFKHQSVKQDKHLMPEIVYRHGIVEREFASALKQLGTLGGGNHFIEIQKDNDGHIWIMVHSGSRNIGLQVARHYNNVAKEANKKGYSSVPKKWDLAFLPVDTSAGKAYIDEMQYCVDFAFANRRLMMDRIMAAVTSVAPWAEFDEMINIAHNYAQLEHHFNADVWVHRKGATMARKGQLGIIPGSQGTPSYIVRGKGNPESFQSCSHGAGRKMGRKQAQRELNLEAEKKRLDDLGVIHSVRGKKDLDEAAGAYKNIAEVMAKQSDLVEIMVELRPLAVIKG
ncbi:MAG: RtcB family protein [Deltaproteobacteria bacterium]|nr:RtcB family protein [Deltaproteobacteria bacterium]